MKKIVVLSGAGISAESGIPTFRGSDGLWEGYDVQEVASPEGWRKNPELVLQFYNERRKKVLDVKPNKGHKALTRLERFFDVTIITQNIDNLHERAGSSKVLHLHGEILKARSTKDESLIYDIDGWEIKIGDTCEKGSQLRPHIVWFGEMVPMMDKALEEVIKAEIFIVVGTSLQVYPAASLIDYVGDKVPKYIVDPNELLTYTEKNIYFFKEMASTGLEKLTRQLINDYISYKN